jgi:hypothetical protein
MAFMKDFSLRELWEQVGKKPGFKVRYMGWDHNLEYFLVKSFDEKSNMLHGELNNGETAEYPINSLHWQLYDESREYSSHTI